MKVIKQIIAAVCLLVASAGASSIRQSSPCPANDWCWIFVGAVSGDHGYNAAMFSETIGSTILATTNSLQPGVAANGPEATGFSTYTTQSSTSVTNPLVQLTDCGCNATNEIREFQFVAAAPIGPTDTTITVVQVNGKALNGNNVWPASGTLYMDDEAASYQCVSGCGIGSTQIVLALTARGLYQDRGFLPPYAHGTSGGRTGKGAEINLLCPVGVHPPAYHTSQNPHLENNLLVEDGGTWQETWTNAVRYTLDLTNVAGGWTYFPAYSTGPFPLNYQEGTTQYDPTLDCSVYFGGLHSNPTSDLYVRCNSLPIAYGSGPVGAWKKVTFHAGNTGPRDGARGGYDPDLQKFVFFMGYGNGVNTRTVAYYDDSTGDVCVNEPSFGSSAPSCSLAAMTGTPPADNSQANRWPAVTYNRLRHVWTFFDATNTPYDFDAVNNVWTKGSTTLTAPPAPGTGQWNGRSVTFDPAAAVYHLIEHTNGIFQIFDASTGTH